ncbi:MAG: TonB-dependent receptor [Bacteroidota bacterium]|nr:TonB-dependent receptor [Bacteroidota bacterium]
MYRKLLLLSAFCLFSAFSYAQTALQGTIKDKDSGEPIINCAVAIYKNGVLVTGTITDFDGNFSVQLDPGTYSIDAKYTGYQSRRIEAVVVKAGKVNTLDLKLTSGIQLEVIEVTTYRVPLIEKDNTGGGVTVTAEQIKNLPTKNINAIAGQSAGFSSVDGGAASIRGSRTDGTVYYLDGIRYTGRSIPSSEIDQLQVITGGIEAQYGDVTGGIISLTSKGPSSKISGGLELETSQYLDPYGYNLVSGNISGPIWKRKDTLGSVGRTIMGYRFSGQYNGLLDDNPPAYGVYRAKQSTIDRLNQDPITLFNGSPTVNGQFLKDGEDVEFLKYHPNEENSAIDLTGKIDIRPTSNIDLTFSGTYAYVKDRFTPGDGDATGSGNWSLLNWNNNPMTDNTTYRGNFRFRHRLGKVIDLNAEIDQSTTEQRVSLIQNASYTLQFGYQNSKSETQDFRHKNNIFNHGYVGQFFTEWLPVFDQQTFDHVGFVPITNNYIGGDVNPVWAAYNKIAIPLEQSFNIEGYRAFNSNISTSFDNLWAGIHTNTGSVYNRYNKRDNDIYTLQGNLSLDLVPGGSSKGRHNIQLGLILEQRINRDYTIIPFNLWRYGRLYANDHIIGIDTTQIWYYDTLGRPIYYTLIAPEDDAKFYKSIRSKLYPNSPIDSSVHFFANIDQLKPGDLSLDMFSAAELIEQNVIGYSGYDYLGNKLARNTKFEDFFNGENGVRSHNVMPFSPIYAGGYIQDKFTFNDIIFRLGLRADFYDANTKVIKDPYSIYGILGAKEFHEQNQTPKPGTIGDDFKVYVTGEGASAVRAYRDGDRWYFSNGTPANSSNAIFGENNLVFPAYIQPSDSLRTIRGKYFNVDQSFEDYTPQFNLMPRLAFSFPISEDANFFAHYDILVQRPTSNSFVSPLAYLYWDINGRTPSANGNLKPSKTIDYEVGFQQKITNSSALKISAYYKELRDMIQVTTLSKVASVGTYNTYGNLDFGTVKGFNFTYDLRRTNNFEFIATYTLQFADGTGSDADSQNGLTNKGINIRNIFPFTYDERHRFSFTSDFRYESGKKYNGPRIGGANIFANAGINMQIIAASGRPYSPGQNIVRFDGSGYRGSINGARLPWNFTVDLKADKSFRISKPESKNAMNINVYLRVQNLLDTKNVIGLYRGSGSPEDDGYLASGRGQNEINNTANTYGEENVQYFIDSYNWRLLNPDNYTLPRRIFLGAILEF